jgi:hypothetical protein
MLSPTAKLFIDSARAVAAPMAKAKPREAVKPRAKT